MTESNDNTNQSPPRSRTKKQSNRVLYLFIITIIFLTGGFYFYQKNLQSLQEDSLSGINVAHSQNDSNSDIISKTPSLIKKPTETQANSKPAIPREDEQALNDDPSNNEDIPGKALSIENNGKGAEKEPSVDQTPKNAIYAEQIVELNTFYSHLDSQQYMQDFKLPEPSRVHFSKLIQKLIDNPPTVTRETDDLFTLLKNTAHFFRIIGKENILVLKGILDREKESFEAVLQSLYTLTNKPELLRDEYSVTLDSDSLYDYACFFLNTMGGRLYLFRRDSNSRMAVSFYAIAIIDRANDAGNSRHGIDIRPGIDSLIEEIENGGKNLKMRELYIDTLYDLKEKYN